MYGQFFVLFAIVFTGYLFRRKNIIGSEMNASLNRFIVYFAYPCVIVKNIGTLEIEDSMLRNFFLTLILSVLAYGLCSVLSYVYAKVRKFPAHNSNVAEMAMASSNDGFMGYPVSQIFFGNTGLLLMIARNAALNIYFFSYGLALLRRNNPDRPKTSIRTLFISLVKLLINPNILALIIGMTICLTGIPLEGTAVETYLSYIGNVATPMAMIFIGSTLADKNVGDMFKDRVILESTFGNLILLPFITLAAVYFLPIPALVKQIVVLGGCFPVAATVAMLAEQEKQDEGLASKILFLTTVFSMVTIPLAIKLIQTVI